MTPISPKRNAKADAAVLIAVTEREKPGRYPHPTPQHDARSSRTSRLPRWQAGFEGEDCDHCRALREAEEELAMPRDAVRVVVAPTDRFQTGTGFDITPIVGVIPPDLAAQFPTRAKSKAGLKCRSRLLLQRRDMARKGSLLERSNTQPLSSASTGMAIASGA